MAKQTDDSRKKSRDMTAKDVRQLATDLRFYADRIDRYADTMESVGMKSMRITVGNWYGKTGVIAAIKNFLTTQILGKFIAYGGKTEVDVHEMLRDLVND